MGDLALIILITVVSYVVLAIILICYLAVLTLGMRNFFYRNGVPERYCVIPFYRWKILTDIIGASPVLGLAVGFGWIGLLALTGLSIIPFVALTIPFAAAFIGICSIIIAYKTNAYTGRTGFMWLLGCIFLSGLCLRIPLYSKEKL